MMISNCQKPLSIHGLYKISRGLQEQKNNLWCVSVTARNFLDESNVQI